MTAMKHARTRTPDRRPPRPAATPMAAHLSARAQPLGWHPIGRPCDTHGWCGGPAWSINTHVSYISYSGYSMITAAQLRAARALLGIDQRTLAEAAQLSLPTIQRMEASQGVIRGNVDSLMKLIGALERGGVELIGDNAQSLGGGRGVRLRPQGQIASAEAGEAG